MNGYLQVEVILHAIKRSNFNSSTFRLYIKNDFTRSEKLMSHGSMTVSAGIVYEKRGTLYLVFEPYQYSTNIKRLIEKTYLVINFL